ncbi:MAG: CoA transferase subunit A [Oscillospiraceae bacterium]|nr:CoA transferase subunit A [Oscillospiraceae bacterium]
MKSKVISVDEAIAKYCHTGMSILLPGFVNVGVAETLIDALLKTDITDLSVISNNTSVKGRGIGKLVHENKIKHITCSHIGNNVETCEKVVAGEINVTFVPQGSICEKVRAGGSGIGGILTPTGVHTPMQDGKQLLEWDDEQGKYRFVEPDEPQKGKRYILELPLHAEVAFIHAWKADKSGNCVFKHTSRNFNPVFANAADHVIVEAEEIVEVGELDPDQIITPFFIVDAVVQGKAIENS